MRYKSLYYYRHILRSNVNMRIRIKTITLVDIRIKFINIYKTEQRISPLLKYNNKEYINHNIIHNSFVNPQTSWKKTLYK